MAKKTQETNYLQEMIGKYAQVYDFDRFVSSNTDSKGNFDAGYKTLESRLAVTLHRVGMPEDNIPGALRVARERYDSEDHLGYLAMPQAERNNTLEGIFNDANVNSDKILASTDVEILRRYILPKALQNYKSDDPKYVKLQKLVEEENKLREQLNKLNDEKTQDEEVKKLIDKKAKKYDEIFKDKPEYAEIAKKLLISPSEEVRAVKQDYDVKKKELDETLPNELPSFLSSMNISGQDLVKMYIPFMNEQIEEAMKRAEREI